MKKLFHRVCLFWFLIAAHSFAGSATWRVNPTSNDWYTATNWRPQTVPDAQEDVATFGGSNITNITLANSNHFTVDSIVFSPGASPYTITAAPVLGFLSVWGVGVINNSGVTQNFITDSTYFFNQATAGTNVVYTQPEDSFYGLVFTQQSNAGSAILINDGVTSDLKDVGRVSFFDTCSAETSTIINEEGDPFGGATYFSEYSTAGSSTITAYRNARVTFFEGSTADSATLIADTGTISFLEGSTAGNSTITADGGTIYFRGQSTGGLAQILLTNGGVLDVGIREDEVPITIGSLEGDDGTVHLGGHQLVIGGNGVSTTFGGVITGGFGNIVKTGDKTLTLTGASTYRGGTTVDAGTLLVQTATGSATGTGVVIVNSGIFGGTGNVSGAVTIGDGMSGTGTLSPGVEGPGTLILGQSLTFQSDGNYRYEVGLTRNPQSDQVVANGVTISINAKFNLRSKGTATLPPGTLFTAISNTSPSPISGSFSDLPDGAIITAGPNTLQASYEGGDGNDLTLTVIP